MTIIIFFMILLVAWILPVTLKVKRGVQTLQLHSYQNDSYRRWMSENINRVFSPIEALYLVPVAVFIFFESNTFILAVSSAVFIVIFMFFYASRPKHDKDIVYSPRVQRLFGITYVMYWVGASIATVFGAFGQMGAAVTVLILFALFSFTLVALTNVITEPIEQRINQRYVEDAARLIKASPELKVAGIAGSHGKSSVKQFAAAILSPKYSVLTTPEHYSSKLGITRTINEQLKPRHDVFIAEVGAEKEEEMQEIWKLIQPHYSVRTAAWEHNADLAESWKSTSETSESESAKKNVPYLPAENVAVLSEDDKEKVSEDINLAKRRVYYSLDNEKADIYCSSFSSSGEGTHFTVTCSNGESVEFYTRLLGRHHIQQLLAAIALGLEMDVPLAEMAAPIEQLAPAGAEEAER